MAVKRLFVYTAFTFVTEKERKQGRTDTGSITYGSGIAGRWNLCALILVDCKTKNQVFLDVWI